MDWKFYGVRVARAAAVVAVWWFVTWFVADVVHGAAFAAWCLGSLVVLFTAETILAERRGAARRKDRPAVFDLRRPQLHITPVGGAKP